MCVCVRVCARVYVCVCVYTHAMEWASQVAQLVKNLPAMQETQEIPVWLLDWEDPLEEGMATHSSVLAWRIPWTEEPGGLQSIGLQRVGHDWGDWACTMEYCSALEKNEIWMDLEIIILSEVTQKEKANTIWYNLHVEYKIWHK